MKVSESAWWFLPTTRKSSTNGFALAMVPLGFLYLLFVVFSRVLLRSLTANPGIIKYALILSTPTALILDTFVILFGLLTLVFAMWFDMEYNRDLR